VDIQREAERFLLARFVPPSVIVDADTKILHFRGDVGRYRLPISSRAFRRSARMTRLGSPGPLASRAALAHPTRA
jgi:hypothetical protein